MALRLAFRPPYDWPQVLAFLATRGESFTIYDATRKVWHQTWVTNKGQLLTVEGRFQGDRLTMEGAQPSPDGHATIVRGVWMPEAGGVRETAHTSIDGGSSWRPLFDIFFQRHKAGAAVPDRPEQARHDP